MKILMQNNITYSIINPIYDDSGEEIISDFYRNNMKNIIDVTEEELESIGKTKQYLNGKLVDYTPPTDYLNEKQEIEKWFVFYDNQISQYNRAERLLIPYDEKYGSIAELDNQAVEKAKRLNELKEILKTQYNII